MSTRENAVLPEGEREKRMARVTEPVDFHGIYRRKLEELLLNDKGIARRRKGRKKNHSS